MPIGDDNITPPPRRWHWTALIVCHLGAAMLLGSWLWSVTRPVWDVLDETIFFAFNGSLTWGQTWQTLWAVTNTRGFDTLSACLMIALLVVYIAAGGNKQLVHRLTAAAYLGLCLLLIIFITREFLLSGITRDSPSRQLEPFHDLQQLTPYNPKVDSGRSFPGDHGVVMLIFTGIFWYFAGARYGFIALALAIWFMLPRIVGGAHWFTDLAVGSVVIAAIALSWVLATPLPHHAHRPLARLMGKIIKSGPR